MGISSSKRVAPSTDEIAAGLFPLKSTEPRIFSLDGNIGVGKSTLLKQIANRFPDVLILQEPVDVWTALKNSNGESLLELFYKDKRRYAYTFQNAAILSRLKLLRNAVQTARPGQIILTERSVLTDRHVFAEMLREQGFLDDIEWQLYTTWFDTFAKDLPMAGIIHITTSADTAFQRIQTRARDGEGLIDPTYLSDLAAQHLRWLRQTYLPVLRISTETGTDMEETLTQLKKFMRVE